MRHTLRETFRIARERHTLKFLVTLGVVGAVALFGGGYRLALQTSDNKQTTRALCALKDDVKRRAQSSRDYLTAHPNGAPGIPAKVIRDGIVNQQRTVDALRGLKCPD